MGFRSCFLNHKVFLWKIVPPFLRIRFFQRDWNHKLSCKLHYQLLQCLEICLKRHLLRQHNHGTYPTSHQHQPPRTWHQDAKRILVPTERRGQSPWGFEVYQAISSSQPPLRAHQKKHWSHETINNLQVSNVQRKNGCLFYQKMWRDSHTTPVFEGES